MHWLAPSLLFGPRGKSIEGHTEAWCIAKIQRLVGPIDPPINTQYEEDFSTADELVSTIMTDPETNMETQLITVGNLRREMENLPGPPVSAELLDFIEYLLVVDHTQRPTAQQALSHPYLKSTS